MKEKKQLHVKILVACHKADPAIRQDDIYMPIQVGKALHPELDLGFRSDDTGDNISDKNGSYCELTALYWAWKNLKDVDYIGLCHYRRYLDVDLSDIESVIDENSIILTRPNYTPFSNLMHLTDGTTREDVYILLQYLAKHERRYLSTAIDYLFNDNGWIGCNMFISDRRVADGYCSWLFNILRNLESYIKVSPYTRLKRIYGYLAEVLLPIYCISNNIKIKYAAVSDDTQNNLRYSLKKIYLKSLFRLTNIKKATELNIPSSTLVSLKSDNIII